MESRENGVEVVAHEHQPTFVVPVADFVRIVVDNKVSGPARDRAGRGSGEHTASARGFEIVGPGVAIPNAGRKHCLIPPGLHQVTNLAAE